MMPRVREVTAPRRVSAVNAKPSSTWVRTMTGVASASLICSTSVGQPGMWVITSSTAPNSGSTLLNSACLPPALTMTSDGEYSTPLSMRCRSMMARFNDRRHEIRDRPAEGDHFLHEPRADVGVRFGWHHEDGLHLGIEVAVHQRHLHFVLEIGNRAQPAHDHARPLPASVLDEQSVEGVHFHIGVLREHFARYRDALGHGEERRLVDVHQHRDDDAIEQPRAPLD